MRISIIVPTYNNLKFLKFFINSIKNNSNFDHQIILHINDGSDGTLDFAKDKRLEFTHSKINIGLCSSLNKASTLVKTNFILYAHDDMYFCKDWDIYLTSEIDKYPDELFYLSGTNISIKNGLINFDCGTTPENFNHIKFDNFCKNDQSTDLQGSHWAPHVVHRKIWNKIGGFSEEFNPGDGSDPDFCMKLWNNNVRIFKTISKFKVYHFNSITTRKSQIRLNNGTKTFLIKYGFNPRFFRKYYLRGDNQNKFDGKLQNPSYSLIMIIELIINKIKYYYFKLFK